MKLRSLVRPAPVLGFTVVLALLLGTVLVRREPVAPTLSDVPTDRGEDAVIPLPQRVLPSAPVLHYSGRWDQSNPAVSVCAWSASAVTLRFRGSAVQAQLALGINRVEVVVDGVAVKVLAASARAYAEKAALANTSAIYNLATDLAPGTHTVSLFKATEGTFGKVCLEGFLLEATARVLPLGGPPHSVVVIGDSISAGYGIEALSTDEHFSPETENAYRAYGALAARAFGADYSCFAWSGRTMWPSNTIPAVFDRILPKDPNSHWSGWAHPPEVILVNLATNDFNRAANPSEEPWIAAYQKFLDHLRVLAPKATIYVAMGPMLSDDWPEGRHALSTARRYLQRVVGARNNAGDMTVHYLEFDGQKVSDGLGADRHPSLKTHQIMAAKFIAAIQVNRIWGPPRS